MNKKIIGILVCILFFGASFVTITDNNVGALITEQNENKLITYNKNQPSYQIYQDGNTWYIIPIYREENVESFYDYHDGGGYTPFMVYNVSKIYFYIDMLTDELSLIMHHSKCQGSSKLKLVDFDFENIPDGVSVCVSDDPLHVDRQELDITLEPEGHWNFNEGSDGGVLCGLPTDEEWSLTINPDFIQNITSWFYQEETEMIELDMNKSLIISYNPIGGNPVADANGPYYGNSEETITFNGSGSYDPNGVIVNWSWDFGDGNLGYGEFTNHSYLIGGEYMVNLTVTDNLNGTDYDLTIAYVNSPPDAPIINGPTSGKPNIEYNFSFYSYDPDGDDVSYYIDWGDGMNNNWSEYYIQGVLPFISHIYTFEGTFTIKAKAKDYPYGAESDWAEYIVTMPRTKPNNFPFYWLQNFLQSHPNLFPIIRQILSQEKYQIFPFFFKIKI